MATQILRCVLLLLHIMCTATKANPTAIEELNSTLQPNKTQIPKSGCTVRYEAIRIHPPGCKDFLNIVVNFCAGTCKSWYTSQGIYCYSYCIEDQVISTSATCNGAEVLVYKKIKSCKCSKVKCKKLSLETKKDEKYSDSI